MFGGTLYDLYKMAAEDKRDYSGAEAAAGVGLAGAGIYGGVKAKQMADKQKRAEGALYFAKKRKAESENAKDINVKKLKQVNNRIKELEDYKPSLFSALFRDATANKVRELEQLGVKKSELEKVVAHMEGRAASSEEKAKALEEVVGKIKKGKGVAAAGGALGLLGGGGLLYDAYHKKDQ